MPSPATWHLVHGSCTNSHLAWQRYRHVPTAAVPVDALRHARDPRSPHHLDRRVADGTARPVVRGPRAAGDGDGHGQPALWRHRRSRRHGHLHARGLQPPTSAAGRDGDRRPLRPARPRHRGDAARGAGPAGAGPGHEGRAAHLDAARARWGGGATASFEVALAADVPGGAELTTAASPQGGTCSAGDPCATSLTVAGDPPAPSTTTTTATTTTEPMGPSQTAAPNAPSTRAGSTTPSTTPRRAPLATISPSADPVADCTQPQVPNATVLGGFEIDGNLCANTANFDWSNVGGQPVGTDGFGDSTQWTGGAGENGWPWTVDQTAGSGTSASNGDIGNVYAFTHVVDDHVFAYNAWQRAAVTGTAGFFVEFNQKPNRFGPVPDRTTGDLRLLFVKAGGADLTFSSASTWRSTGTNSGTWVALPDLAGFAGAANPASGVTDLSGNLLPQGAFVEVGIDLTALFPAEDCSNNFGTVNIRSASSLSASSPPLQDWVAPIDKGIPSTCASVLVNKSWEIDGTPFANGSQPPGFSATLALTGRTDPQFGVTYDRRSDGTFYLAGDAVTIG